MWNRTHIGAMTNTATSGTSINIPNRIFSELIGEGQSVVTLAFTEYQTSNLFPLIPTPTRHPKFQIATMVIGASIAEKVVSASSQNVTMRFEINPVSCYYTLRCCGGFQ